MHCGPPSLGLQPLLTSAAVALRMMVRAAPGVAQGDEALSLPTICSSQATARLFMLVAVIPQSKLHDMELPTSSLQEDSQGSTVVALQQGGTGGSSSGRVGSGKGGTPFPFPQHESVQKSKLLLILGGMD
ncbi:hypothetical protein RRG08_024998 [Elysia crispata]|uniref:Uncharacterized protein n=1 Tax=Elysia crispata TaxID=231223 RepID=A0AAE1A8L3_9GAST|nr:hypothetical protein RRG08_024998 [Elysia crispata]